MLCPAHLLAVEQAVMQESAKRRLNNLGAHFDLSRKVIQPNKRGPDTFDVAALQHLLEHDNWETRQKLKELMRSDLFVP